MKMVLMRTMQLLVLAGIVMLLPARRAEANDIVCYAICAYDDWQCIFETGHPADPCAYDSSHDICTLGGCTLGPIQM
jgi:hypothetical protein